MTVLVYVLSAPLVLEFLFAPFNLWSGRTIENWVRFTGLEPQVARLAAAPFKLATAVTLAVGLLWPVAGEAGAAATIAVSAFYLLRLAASGRRAKDGLAAFTLTGVLAVALLVVQAVR